MCAEIDGLARNSGGSTLPGDLIMDHEAVRRGLDAVAAREVGRTV
jgi:hypothetical protein